MTDLYSINLRLERSFAEDVKEAARYYGRTMGHFAERALIEYYTEEYHQALKILENFETGKLKADNEEDYAMMANFRKEVERKVEVLRPFREKYEELWGIHIEEEDQNA